VESTVPFEAAVARRHSPEIAWPTIVLTTASLGLWIAASWLYLAGDLPLWIAVGLNTLVMYVLYTPLHDAAHSAVIPRRKNLRWVNTVVGIAAAIPIFMYFHQHRKQHFIHHAKTNQPGDPDQFAFGSFPKVALVKTPLMLLNFVNGIALYRDCRAIKLGARETRLTLLQFSAVMALLIGLVVAGYGYELVMLWLIPWFVGMWLMQIAFGWFPHHDHSETGRYRDTRIALFPGGDTLFLFQNLHLIHHMLPAVPFYRYRAVFDELRPALEAHGARIEGFWPYSKPSAA